MARSGMGPSCAVEPGTLGGGITPAGAGTAAASAKIGLGTARIAGHWSRSIGQDRRYRQRGRTVARP